MLIRTLLLETNGCILLIASYYLLKNICHIEALEDVFPWCFPFCQGMKNRIQGRVTDRIECYGVFASPCRFSWPFMMGQQTESDSFYREISLVHCEKHSDIFRTRQKKQRQLQQLVQHNYINDKVFVSPRSCPWIRFALHQRTRSRPTFGRWATPPIFPLGLSAQPWWEGLDFAWWDGVWSHISSL